MLLTNGRIHTLDAEDTVVDTLVIRDGRVAFAGRGTEVNAVPGEPVLDLGGRAVLPGLVDAHAHLAMLAKTRLELRVAHLPSEDAAAAVVAHGARTASAGEWLIGRGWDETLWPGRARPTRATLDRAAPGNPVALTRVDGHATWANSAALRAAGIDRHAGDPAGGLVVKDAAGEPTGILVDAAQDLVRAVIPAPSEERFERAVLDALAECVAKGLTGIHEMGVDLTTLGAYRRLVERGRFALRNYVAVSGRKAWAEYRERGRETIGDGRVVVGALKLWLDGALGSRGAALHSPYCDAPGNLGLVLIPPDELLRLLGEARDAGFQACVHAIGDRANTLALDAMEKTGVAGRRFRIEHAQVLMPADIPRFARLGVLPSMQQTHCTSDMRWAAERLGAERLPGAYAWRSLLETGTIIAGGSDFPVEDANPFHGLHAAVTRRPLDGDHPGWQPEQRMTRVEAVRSFTSWNAWAAGQEAELGSLERGKRADLVVLSDDVMTCDEAKIKTIAPVMTLVGGATVFSREEFS
ncbi:MAG: amidohydrolase [Candidatus Rokubacteria bacterium]|nr:amidohydrolase [Candidatus Rokubacteria bacterium]